MLGDLDNHYEPVDIPHHLVVTPALPGEERGATAEFDGLRWGAGISIAATAGRRLSMAGQPVTLVALTLLLSMSTLSAQTLPNFTGSWKLDVPRSNVQTGTAKTLVIVQTADGVTIERQVDGRQEVMTYQFRSAAEMPAAAQTPRTPDAASEPRPADQPGGPTGVQATAAEWKNGGLETTAVLMISGKAVTQKTRRTLNLTGTEMTVETLLAVQHGYQNGESSATAREVYIKEVK